MIIARVLKKTDYSSLHDSETHSGDNSRHYEYHRGTGCLSVRDDDLRENHTERKSAHRSQIEYVTAMRLVRLVN